MRGGVVIRKNVVRSSGGEKSKLSENQELK